MSPELGLNTVRPVYTLVGDEVYFRDKFCAEVVALVPPGMEEFSLFDEDLATTPLDDILDRARTPSLMAPLQIFFVRNAKELFGRGASATESDAAKDTAKKSKRKHGDFPANLERFVTGQGGGTAAVLVFLADHLHLPADRQRMSLEDKGKLQRIEATLGACGALIPCARVPETTAATLARDIAASQNAELTPPAARLLAEMLEGNLGLMRQEVAKLAAHALPGRQITPEAVTQLVAASRVGSSFELAQRLGRGDRAGSLASLERIWTDEGDGGAIGLVFQLSRAFKMALILRQEKVRDRSGIYRVLPEGLRPPGFAADAVLGLSRSMPEPRLREGIRRLHNADVALRSQPPTMKGVFEDLIVALTRA